MAPQDQRPARRARGSSRGLGDLVAKKISVTGTFNPLAGQGLGAAAASAFRRSAGALGSGSSGAGAISSVTTSPGFNPGVPGAPAAWRIFRSTLSQWPPWPSGSSVARKGKPLSVPSTVTGPREGSFALASLGRVRKVQETALAVGRPALPRRVFDTAGRRGEKSVALKRIFEAVLESSGSRMRWTTRLTHSFLQVCLRPTCDGR